MKKEIYLEEIAKIRDETMRVNHPHLSDMTYFFLKFDSLAKYGITDKDLTEHDYHDIISEAEEIIDFLDAE